MKELRRELEGAEFDTTEPPPSKNKTTASGGHPSKQSLGGTISTPTTSLSTWASSAEYVVNGIKQHKLAAAIVIMVVLTFGITFFAFYPLGRTANAAITSIAVMPFVNESGNVVLEYLSDYIRDNMILRFNNTEKPSSWIRAGTTHTCFWALATKRRGSRVRRSQNYRKRES